MDYVKIAATVTRLINKNGRTTYLQKLSSTAADAGKPWRGPGTPTIEIQLTVKGVFVPPSGEALGGMHVTDDMLKEASEILLLGPNDQDLTTFHMVLDNGIRWAIQWVATLRPADDVLLYAVGVKR